MLDHVRTTGAPAPLLVSVDDDAPVTWLVFCALNADAFDAGELEAIRREIEATGSYVAGGGAAPDVVIRAVEPTGDVQVAPPAADAADRLLSAALASVVDLGDATACAVMLASGPGSDPGLSWDAFSAARSRAIRLLQARVRAAGLTASPPTLRAALTEVEGIVWDRPECAAAFEPLLAVLHEMLGQPAASDLH